MIAIKSADWQNSEDNIALISIRKAVFIDEQQVPASLEWDEQDESALHWLAFDDGKPVGCVRMLSDGHIGRMAVLAPYRLSGIGKGLLDAAITRARIDEHYEVFLYAQVQARGFYERAGFTGSGNEFMDAGIAHTTLRKTLSDRRLVGKHGGTFNVTDVAGTVLDLVQQAERKLRILSPDLDPGIFDNDTCSTACSTLARRHRDNEVNILLFNGRQVARHGHHLLTLHRRLSSVRMRKPAGNPNDIKEALIIVDHSAVLVQSIREPAKCWANFYNRPLAEDYIAQFDELWHRSSEDPELRQLTI